MHEKQIPMQEWICMKCPHTSHVEVDQFLNSQHAWACWDMVARWIVFEIPRLTFKCTHSLAKWIDNLSRYWWIPNCILNFVYWTQMTSSKRLVCFLFRENLLGFVSRLLFCFTSSVSSTQNKCPKCHHNHPRHPFFRWIYRECKAQNGLIL